MDTNKNINIVCPNCEKEFDSSFDYCPHCGQKNKKLELQFKHFFHDFISGAFNLDSKIFRTLRLLIFQPGELPKLFLAGKRTMYVPPVRLYLIISLIYFTLLSFVGDDFVKWTDNGDKDLAQLDSISGLSGDHEKAIYSTEEDTTETNEVVTLNNSEELEKVQTNDADTTLVKKESKWDKFYKSRAKKLGTNEGKEAFQSLMRKYINIGMFVLMPVTALIFFLLFYKDTYYIQHLVFVLHLQSMMFVLFITMNIVELVFKNVFIEVLTLLLFLFILLIWIKKFYEIGWVKTIWKSILFLALYGISLVAFLLILLFVSAWNL